MILTEEDREKIYTAYSGKVMGYIMARVRRRAEAEDLTADVFEKVYRKIGDYDRTKSSLSTWIFTITRNTLIDSYRRKRPTEELSEEIPDLTELDEDLLQTETLEELARALRSLEEELRDIVVLRYYDGKPLTEIAELMGLSYGAVKIRHQKALNEIRRLMGDEENAPRGKIISLRPRK
ncbi:MAG: sigma-70 family RNA polymerase sigma factor [Clostridia bacterium]|nr:sigma-70 family RNA polymerase sigma factor [Clostridia bacterium]